MIELVFYNSSSHRQHRWLGDIVRVSNLAVESTTAIALEGEEQRVDFTLSLSSVNDRPMVRIHNHGSSLVLPGGQRISAGMQRDSSLPIQFWVGRTHVTLTAINTAHPHDGALTCFPSLLDPPDEYAAAMKKLGTAPAALTLAHWFSTLSQLQQSVAGSSEFFHQAAFSLFDPGGLDASLVLLYEQGEWVIRGSHVAYPGLAVSYRRELLEKMLETGRTLFHDARRVEPEQLTLCDAFVVVAPIANQAGETIGALYGIRHDHPQNQRRGIRPLEAQFVQAVAETVSASMQRLEKEREAAKLRVRMEQVFSPGLARELERNPRLLEGDQREITVMFADMRGFSSLSEQLSPRELYQLLGDAMDRLTAVILRQEGILIDYYGDGFSAFWNAPVPQPNHAYLACEAARQIQRELEDLNADWQGFTGRRLRMGIGIHTGIALVGNSGSRQRIKYGPRGSTVNLAARIENATKQLGVPILMSGESQRLLGTALPTQRVFRQTFEGMSKPVDLYQPLESERTNTQVLETFAQALAAFDKQQWEPSLEILEQLRAAGYSDAPLDHLLRKTREHFTPTLGSRLL